MYQRWGTNLLGGQRQGFGYHSATRWPVLDYVFGSGATTLAEAEHNFAAITFTRGSSGTHFDSSGILQTASTNVARFDHDPVTGSPLGLLIEEQRENVVVRSTAIKVGWSLADGATSTLDSAIVAPDGTTGEVYKIDLSDGSGDARIFQDVSARTTADVVMTGSIWLRSVTGTGTWPLVLGDGTNFLTLAASLTTTWQRFSLTQTPGSGLKLTFFYPGNKRDDTESTTLDEAYAWSAQAEVGSFSTSYVAAVLDAAVTRSADVATIALSVVPGFNQSAGTLYVGGSFPHANGASMAVVIDDGGTSDRVYFERDADENINFVTTHSADTDGASNGAAVIAENTTFKAAGAYADDDVIAAVDGTLSAADTAAAFPLGDDMTTIRIGNDSGTVEWNGHIARLVYWNSRLPDSQLQALTA